MPDPTPQVVELSNQFRARLLQRERQAATQMVTYYGATWRRLQGDISTLQTDIQARRDAGETIGPGTIWRMERMQAIQTQAGAELARYSQFAADTVAAGKRESMVAGSRDAAALVQASFLPEHGIQVNFATMPRAAVEQMAGFLADGSPLNEVIAKYAGDAVQGFGSTMVTGIAAGWNPNKLARELRAQFGMGLTDSIRLARTEQLRAYRAATLNTYRANSHVVKGWERHAQHDTRTCAACLMLDGRIYSLKEGMDDHVAGRCALLPRTKSYKELGINAPEPDFVREKGADWLQRQSEADQHTVLKALYRPWKDGLITLDQIPKLITSETWGNSWVPSALKDLVSGEG